MTDSGVGIPWKATQCSAVGALIDSQQSDPRDASARPIAADTRGRAP